jgi:uncharacterized protein
VRNLIKTRLVALVLSLALAVPVAAGPFEDGYESAKRGDYATAIRLFRSLAGHGNASAQFNLAVMYFNGHGVPQDYAAAASWCRKAADQGNSLAQYYLGNMYLYGQGVSQELVSALVWLKLAAEGGIEDAAVNRDIAASRMHPAQITEAEKRAAEWRPK